MKSFENDFIERQPITQGLLQTVRAIGEYKGKQDLFKEQAPQILESLRQAAIIQSTESSNRIEGITAPLERIKEIVADKTTPRNRPEQEIAGYRDVLNTIHANHSHIPFTTGMVLQLHRDLYKFASGSGGRWKTAYNTY
jgi:Fic family protein